MLKPVFLLIVLCCGAGLDPVFAFAPKPQGPVRVTLAVNPLNDSETERRILDVQLVAESSLDLASTRIQVQLAPAMVKLSGSTDWQGTLLRGESRRLSFQVEVTQLPASMHASMFVLINGAEQLAAQDIYTDNTITVKETPRQVSSGDDFPLSRSLSTGVQLQSTSLSHKSDQRRIVEYRLD